MEVNSETDFVARNPEFQGMVTTIASLAPAAAGDLDKLKALHIRAGKSVADKITEMVGTIGENMALRRTAAVSVATALLRLTSTIRLLRVLARSACW